MDRERAKRGARSSRRGDPMLRELGRRDGGGDDMAHGVGFLHGVSHMRRRGFSDTQVCSVVSIVLISYVIL